MIMLKLARALRMAIRLYMVIFQDMETPHKNELPNYGKLPHTLRPLRHKFNTSNHELQGTATVFSCPVEFQQW